MSRRCFSVGVGLDVTSYKSHHSILYTYRRAYVTLIDNSPKRPRLAATPFQHALHQIYDEGIHITLSPRKVTNKEPSYHLYHCNVKSSRCFIIKDKPRLYNPTSETIVPSSRRSGPVHI